MFSKKGKPEIPPEKEKNEVMEFFTDPVYAYSSLYGIELQEKNSSSAPEEQNK